MTNRNEIRFELSDQDKAMLDALATDLGSTPGRFVKRYVKELLKLEQTLENTRNGN